MANLRTDSPASRRIVRAFLDFLSSVEPASGDDIEGLEVARECLEETFKLGSFPDDDRTMPDSLVDIFSSLGKSKAQENKADLQDGSTSVDVLSSSLAENGSDENLSYESKPQFDQPEDSTAKTHGLGTSRDELCGQFFAALEKIRYFRIMPDGTDDPAGVEKAIRLFHDALAEMENLDARNIIRKTWLRPLNQKVSKSLTWRHGAMQKKLYSDAIELYNCAIALCENNAVYYCNRAAAYTQAHKYSEAVEDCLKSIEIDPSYSKAYSRLGTAYFVQGNYTDAINKGFKKALQLDPGNEVVKENIRMAEQKLREDQQRAERDQGASSSGQSNSDDHNQSTGGSRSQTAPPLFGSMPFNPTALPAGLANMFMNMATNAHQGGQHSQSRQGHDGNTDEFDDPGVQIGGNINLNFGEQMPEELTGALRSVMEMFSGAAGHANSQDTSSGTGRSAPPS